ncbi:Uncharacterised protein [Mycobacterium tuberculosis]|nr:Uncharacterised protein [Mycobacterium tuberculosis]
MRKIFFLGFFFVVIIAAEVMVSTMVMCWPGSGCSSSGPITVVPTV